MGPKVLKRSRGRSAPIGPYKPMCSWAIPAPERPHRSKPSARNSAIRPSSSRQGTSWFTNRHRTNCAAGRCSSTGWTKSGPERWMSGLPSTGSAACSSSWAGRGSGFRAARQTGLVKTTGKGSSLSPRTQQSLHCGWIPLTPTDVENILRGSLAVRDPSGFVEQAHERGVDGLLFNPQGLELLVAAVHQGSDWPNSRIETFELACGQMAREQSGTSQCETPWCSDRFADRFRRAPLRSAVNR